MEVDHMINIEQVNRLQTIQNWLIHYQSVKHELKKQVITDFK